MREGTGDSRVRSFVSVSQNSPRPGVEREAKFGTLARRSFDTLAQLWPV
jgi:hypothetical protein